jgi:ABC-type polar amino acid transport system ATPase subunit
MQLFQMFKKKNPYLDSNMINEEIMFTCETHVNEDTSNIIKYIQHQFKYEIQNFVFNEGQLKIFDILINETKELHVLEGILGSGKTFFVKYITHYFQTQGKNVLLTTITIGSTTLRLSQHACTIYILNLEFVFMVTFLFYHKQIIYYNH